MAKESAQYLGPGMEGGAVVYGREAPNLFQLMDQMRANREAQEAIKREENKARGEAINKMLEYSPSEVWQEYDEEVRKEYEDEYLNYVTKIYSDGRTPTTEELVEVQRRKNRIEGNVNYYNGYKESFEDAVETTLKGEEAKYYNQDAVNEYIGRINYDENGRKRSKNELTPELVNDMYNQRGIYNESQVVEDFVESFGNEKFQRFEKEHGGLVNYTVEASGIFEMDGNELKIDNNGKYILKPSKEAFKSAMADPKMRKLIEWRREDMAVEQGDENVSNFDAFEQMIKGRGDVKETASHKWDQKPTKSTSSTKQKQEAAMLRKQIIARMQNGDSEIISQLIGAKSGNRYIVESSWDDNTGSIVVKYNDDEEETISSGNFKRLNDLYSTLPNQGKVSDELLYTTPEATNIPSFAKLDLVTLDKDISAIQNGDSQTVSDILSKIPGIEKAGRKLDDDGNEMAVIVYTIDGVEEEIDVSEENDGGYDQLKDLILSLDRESYTTSSSGTNKGVGSKYN